MIAENVRELLRELPQEVQLEAAAKTRGPEEVLKAINAGVTIIGENYVQEAEGKFAVIGDKAKWHLIGHLQRNKVNRAVKLLDMIETVDSLALASEIDRRCTRIGKTMPVLIEVNSGREEQKSGVLPESVKQLAREISAFQNIGVMGLMTMGPQYGNPEDSRPYFVDTRKTFEKIKLLGLPDVEMKYLSMGMTNSYRIAIEEGANMVRLGSRIFGERDNGEDETNR